MNELRARITISGEQMQAIRERDELLASRMKRGGLTLQQQVRAWSRIHAARWSKVLRAELAALVAAFNDDLKVHYQPSIAAELSAPSLLSRFIGADDHHAPSR